MGLHIQGIDHVIHHNDEKEAHRMMCDWNTRKYLAILNPKPKIDKIDVTKSASGTSLFIGSAISRIDSARVCGISEYIRYAIEKGKRSGYVESFFSTKGRLGGKY